jgi:hypothetical protein
MNFKEVRIRIDNVYKYLRVSIRKWKELDSLVG